MSPASAMLRHDALIYGTDGGFLDVLVPFVREGLGQDEAVVAVTSPGNIALLREALDADAEHVAFVDAAAWYSHPMRTIAGYSETLDDLFAKGAPRVRVIGEVQFGATEQHRREWARYEAALNAVFADRAAWIVCPYDERVLPPWVIETATRTHPHVWNARSRTTSGAYDGPDAAARQLPPPPPLRGRPLADLQIGDELAAARRTIQDIGASVGLGAEAVDELALALTEALTNALVHGHPPVRLRVFHEGTALTCEITETGGGFDDPLAGFMRATANAEGGRGLWLLRHLCDHVEFLPRNGKTVLRLSKSLLA